LLLFEDFSKVAGGNFIVKFRWWRR